MKAYGRELRDELEYGDKGCPSKHRRIRDRKGKRRLLHQGARRAAKAEIDAEVRKSTN